VIKPRQIHEIENEGASANSGVIAKNPADIGCLTEAIITTEMLRRGYEVLRPVAHHSRYDLVVMIDNEFKTAQCKTGRHESGLVKFNAYSQTIAKGKLHRRSYHDEVDIFLVYCQDINGLYLVPVNISPKGTCTLRIDPAKNNQMKEVLWAKDYII